jgi:hypothetical protein
LIGWDWDGLAAAAGTFAAEQNDAQFPSFFWLNEFVWIGFPHSLINRPRI